jgi:hypothetical protein
MSSFWLEMPASGEVLWEFVRSSDKKKLRCELRDAAPHVWQVILYQDDHLIAWHSGFSVREGAEKWARGTKATLSRRMQRPKASTTVTRTPPQAPPTMYCPKCAQPLEYQQSFVTALGATTHQWDRFRCSRGCGEFEYRPQTGRLAKPRG